MGSQNASTRSSHASAIVKSSAPVADRTQFLVVADTHHFRRCRGIRQYVGLSDMPLAVPRRLANQVAFHKRCRFPHFDAFSTHPIYKARKLLHVTDASGKLISVPCPPRLNPGPRLLPPPHSAKPCLPLPHLNRGCK
jgi:hypothetical protein